MSTLAIPKVNMNGNTKESLVDELNLMRGHLQAALQAMIAAEFTHGRNFQLQTPIDGGVTHRKAIDEHAERIRKVNEVARELLTLATEIQNQ